MSLPVKINETQKDRLSSLVINNDLQYLMNTSSQRAQSECKCFNQNFRMIILISDRSVKTILNINNDKLKRYIPLRDIYSVSVELKIHLHK